MSFLCYMGEVGLEEGRLQPWGPMTLGHGPVQAALVTPVAKLTFSAGSIM